MLVLQALLEQQLAVERGKMETEKKKFQHAMDEKVKFHLLYCMIPLHTQKNGCHIIPRAFDCFITWRLANSLSSSVSSIFLYLAKIVMFDTLNRKMSLPFLVVSFPLWLNKNIFYFVLYFHFCKGFQRNLPFFLRREC